MAAGLVIGKVVGVVGATWLAVRFRMARLPVDATWGSIVGIGGLAGIGFTVSIFVAGLAFDSAELTDAAKLAVLGASVLASAFGALWLVMFGARGERPD